MHFCSRSGLIFFFCENCGKTFERTETISEHEALKPPCPKCGSKKVSFVPGRVYVVTTKKSWIPLWGLIFG